ncbi:MAG: glycosyltransferase family 39 protein [Candidatus Zixiibacteriota bacterium]
MRLQKYHKYLIIILATGILLRIANIAFFLNSPLSTITSPDELYHQIWAMNIAEGQIIPRGVFFRAPLYPYILSVLYAIFGESEIAARLPGMLAGILSIFMAFKLGKKIGQNAKVGLIAALLIAINPVLIYFESRLLLDILLVPFGMIIFYLILLWKDKRRKSHIFLAGFFAGLFAITRPTILPIFIIYLFFLLLKKHIRAAVLILMGFIIPILPITVSNIANGSFTLIASQGGVNFYIGNNEESDGISAAIPELGDDWQYKDAVRLARAEFGKKHIDSRDVSVFYIEKGLSFWKNQFGDAITLYIKKLYLAFDGVFLGNNGDISFFRRYSPILWIPNISGILFAIAIFTGIFYIKKNPKIIVPFGFAILYGLLIAVFFVNTRFRLPIYAALIPIASFGLYRIIDDIKIFIKKPERIFVLLVLVLFLSIDFIGAKGSNRGSFYFTLGNSYLIKENLDEAKSAFEKSLHADSLKDGSYLNLGLIEYKKKNFNKAKEYFFKEIEIDGEKAKAYSNLGLINRLQNNKEEAIEYGKKAIEQKSDLRDAYYNLAMTYNYFDMPDSSLYYAQKGHEEYPGDIRIMYALANGYRITNQINKSADIYLEIIDSFGKGFIESYDFGSSIQSRWGFSRDDKYLVALSHFNLSVFSGQNEDYKRMYYHLQRSVNYDSTFTKAQIQLGNYYMGTGKPDSALHRYEIAEDLGSNNPILHYNKGIVLSQLHRFKEAREEFLISLENELTKEATKTKLSVVDSILQIIEENRE